LTQLLRIFKKSGIISGPGAEDFEKRAGHELKILENVRHGS
jgi:hypothetical protein